jgi:hypothetical protein
VQELLKYFPFDNVFMDTHLYHGFNVADVGESTWPRRGPSVPSLPWLISVD